ncbi:MAG: hypothetical protein CFH42_00972 [Alphaproteobacteria bacterium MarineAlpha12_Bin1]|nr:MAG: hypothetical protein CFH42_00972 [Alphaproteobacteria bacterium MarineAlpha12_Bin1]
MMTIKRIKLPHRKHPIINSLWESFPPLLRSKIMTRIDVADLKFKEAGT